jgi:hypothetical protein
MFVLSSGRSGSAAPSLSRACTSSSESELHGNRDRPRVAAEQCGSGLTDLCGTDPGFEVDLYVETDLRTMTGIWMGLATVEQEVGAERMRLTGDRGLRQAMQRWLGLSVFARERKLAA